MIIAEVQINDHGILCLAMILMKAKHNCPTILKGASRCHTPLSSLVVETILQEQNKDAKVKCYEAQLSACHFFPSFVCPCVFLFGSKQRCDVSPR